MIRILFNFILASLFVAGVTLSAVAQESVEADFIPLSEDVVTIENALPDEGEVPAEKPAFIPLSVQDDTPVDEIPSLFFTPETLALLKDAIGGLNATAMGFDSDDGQPKDPGVRELALGGIVFNGEDDWTIWLNGRRILPNAIPEEVFDLKVHEEYIDIKWYDAYTNRIFPIRLRPNERFNLDSRLFLTGSHTEENQL